MSVFSTSQPNHPQPLHRATCNIAGHHREVRERGIIERCVAVWLSRESTYNYTVFDLGDGNANLSIESGEGLELLCPCAWSAFYFWMRCAFLNEVGDQES